MESNFWGMWRQFGQGHRCRLVDNDRLTRFETPIAQLPYNAVVRFDAEHGTDDDIDEAVRPYRQRRVPVMWVLHPSSQHNDLEHRLARRGLQCTEVIAGMTHDLVAIDAVPRQRDGVQIVEVGPDRQRSYIELIIERYALPTAAIDILESILCAARFGQPGSPNRSWVASADGRALAKVSVHQPDGVAGIYGLATAHDARRTGLARSLTLHALAAAKQSGAHVAVLHSSPMAADMYRALGFRDVADFRLLAPAGALHL